MWKREDTSPLFHPTDISKDERNRWNDYIRPSRAQAHLFHACNDPLQHLAGGQLLLPFPSTGIIRFQEEDIRDNPSDDKVLRQLPDTDTEAGNTVSHGVGEPKMSSIDRLLYDTTLEVLLSRIRSRAR